MKWNQKMRKNTNEILCSKAAESKLKQFAVSNHGGNFSVPSNIICDTDAEPQYKLAVTEKAEVWYVATYS